MQLIIKEKNKMRINRFLDWLLYMAGYTVVFLLVTSILPSIVIDRKNTIFRITFELNGEEKTLNT